MANNNHHHHHDHDHECDCEHEVETITLLDEDGTEHEFTVVDIIEVDETSYAVLVPEGEEDGDAYIFRIESVGEEDQLIAVEDDDEFERVAAALGQLDDENEEEED